MSPRNDPAALPRADDAPRRPIVARTVLFIAAVAACAAASAQTRLVAATGNADEFGYAVAFAGAHVVSGTPGAASKSGRVYTHECTGQRCSSAVPLVAVDLGPGDLFGAAVSVSLDTLAIGAPGQGSGAVYLYVHDGLGWMLQQKLSPTPAASGDRFGAALALEGDRLVVGAPGSDDAAGAVFVFERSVGTWNTSARLAADDAGAGHAFGSSVALSGDTLIAGAPLRPLPVDGAFSQGAAYVFVRPVSSWTQQARLLSPQSTDGQLFGHSVSLSGARAAIGAPLADLRIGTAFVFERVGVSWTQQAQLLAPAGLPGDRFGWSVAIDGDHVQVGSPFASGGCGGIESFARIGGLWSTQALPPATESYPGALAGWSIAMRVGRSLVGVPGYDGASAHRGAAYLRDAADGLFTDSFENGGAAACLAAG